MPEPVVALIRDRGGPALADTARTIPTRPRVAVVSASFGAGHDGAAAEIARLLTAAGFGVDRHNFVDILPAGWGRFARGGYRRLLYSTPGGWDRILATSGRGSTPCRVAAMLDRMAGARMLAALGSDPVAVVSTYPLASQTLGRLRQRGALRAPAVTFLTDMSVHPLWVAPGIDAHLALHAVPAAQAAALGATRPIVAGAAVRPDFRPRTGERERWTARAAFGLPSGPPLALVVAGSWGVGAVDRAARDIAATGLAHPVVVCGDNEGLRGRLLRDGHAVVLGWVDDMPTLLRACDVVVQNAGGLTSLEAMASRVPVVTYRCLPGHGRTNAAALERAGWASWARDTEALPLVLGAALSALAGPALPRLDTGTLVAHLGARVAA
jgi:glycosyltransferase involved in cell wall biosynthesis